MKDLLNLFKKYYGRIIFAISPVLLAIMGLTACQDTDGGPLGPTDLSKNLTIVQSNLTIAKGGQQTFFYSWDGYSASCLDN